MQNNEQLESIYVQKTQNITHLAMHGLFENIVYLYENKSEFDDKKEIDKLIKRYSELLKLTDNHTNEELDKLIHKCTIDRKSYKAKALEGLHGSYNLDFQTDALELQDKPQYILDESDIDSIDATIEKDYLLTLVEESYKDQTNFDTFTLSSLIALTAIVNKDFYEETLKENIKIIDSNLTETFLNNLKIKSNAILKPYKLKEFANAPLTVFDFYSSLFTAQNQMIVILTFFDEIAKSLDEDILLKDNFFALKKVIVENDDVFLEKIVDRNDELLEQLITENDAINSEIFKQNKTDEAFKSNFLHRYVDFLEEVMFEDLHYFMQSIENATMGINVQEEVLTTLDNLQQPTTSFDNAFQDFFNFIYKNEKKLTFSQKLIFYKSITSLIFTELRFLNVLNNDKIVNVEDLLKTIKSSFKTLSNDETKLVSAYLLD